MKFDCFIFYVNSFVESVIFYCLLLGCDVVEQSLNFVMFMFNDKIMLGFWVVYDVQLGSSLCGGGVEIGMMVEIEVEVDVVVVVWKVLGWFVLQFVMILDFGYIVVMVDLDGYCVWVFRLSQM